jgi:hypothetical protein
MEITFPHHVEYKVAGTVPISEVIGTLYAHERLAAEICPLLESLIDGVHVQKAEFRVRQIDVGSLKEAFFLALVMSFQEDLKKQVPAMISSWFGVEVTERYDTVVTVAVLTLLFWGAEYVVRKSVNVAGSVVLRAQIDDLIEQLADATGKSQAAIRAILEKQFSRPRKAKELGKAAIRFFRPSRNQNNEPIVLDGREIATDVIAQVPNHVDPDDITDEIPPQALTGVRVDIHAKDKDQDAKGWAGYVRTVSDERLKIELFPPITPTDLWEQDTIKADVLVQYKEKGGEIVPHLVHIVRVDGPAEPSPPVKPKSGTQSRSGTEGKKQQ